MKKVLLFLITIYIIFTNSMALDSFSVNYYNISDTEIDNFEWIITESSLIPKDKKAYTNTFFSYFSIGETRKNEKDLKIIKKNQNWDSYIIDYSDKNTLNILKNKIFELISKSDGIFLDNVDSFYHFDHFPYKKGAQALESLLKEIKINYPDKKIIINRGFEILDEVSDYIDGIMIENIYNAYDFKNKRYIKNPELKETISIIKNIKSKYKKLPILIIDYYSKDNIISGNLKNINLYTDIGTIPFFSTIDLDGIYYIEKNNNKQIKNTFLGIFSENRVKESFINKYLQIFFEYFGYNIEYYSISSDLNIDIEKYTGILIHDSNNISFETDKFKKLLNSLSKDQKIILFGDVSDSIISFLKEKKDINIIEENSFRDHFNIVKNKYNSFEYNSTTVNTNQFTDLKDKERLIYNNENCYAFKKENILAVLYEPLIKIGFDDYKWVINPFDLLKDFLNIEYPIPDFCVGSGLRYCFTHLDGDGFNSGSLIYPDKNCTEVLSNEIISKYSNIPFSLSFITAFLDNSFYKKSDELIKNIQSLNVLDNIEVASHSYSHPFYLRKTGINKEYGHNLPVKDYKIDYTKETIGSLNTLKNIFPKKTENMFFYTGDCDPDEEFLELLYSNDIMAINGGDPLMDNRRSSYSYLKPAYTQNGNLKQFYAHSSNEFIYTYGWEKDFNAFKSVIQTYKNSGAPYLLKPVNIYFHFYLVERIAGLRSLLNVFDYAKNNDLCYIYTSDFLKIIREFTEIKIFKNQNSYSFNNKYLRSFKNLSNKKIDFNTSQNIIGMNIINDVEYIITGNKGKTVINYTDSNEHNYNILIKKSNKLIDSLDLDLENKKINIKTNSKYKFIKPEISLFFNKKFKEKQFDIFIDNNFIKKLNIDNRLEYEI